MNQQRQLFGTDGIRGVAGEFPLTKQSTYLIGRALGHDLVRNVRRAQAVIALAAGSVLMAHDWKDRSIWFERGRGSQS